MLQSEVLGGLVSCHKCSEEKNGPPPYRLLRREDYRAPPGFKNRWLIVCETEDRVLAEINFNDVEPELVAIAALLEGKNIRVQGHLKGKEDLLF